MTKLNEQKFEPLFGTWWPKIKPFFLQGGFDKIYEHLKFEARRGKKIAPLSHNVYRCFIETPIKDVKCVILGLCPYHTFTKEGTPVADGLALSCSVTGKLQPSLEQFYNAIEKDVYNGLCLDGEKNPDLTYLANQGVLLLNSALTTEMNKAGSHLEIWEPFIKYLFEEVINVMGVPIIFLGKEANKFSKYTGLFPHNFIISHPASAAYNNIEWNSEGVFKKVTILVKELNNENIFWMNELPF